jgi:hypothetical protein
MASSTPISPTDTSPATTKPVAFAQPRKLSFSRKGDEGQGRAQAHERSGSLGSLRMAIRGPRNRKESIGLPRPLGSPFGVGREIGRGEMEGGDGVGQAI